MFILNGPVASSLTARGIRCGGGEVGGGGRESLTMKSIIVIRVYGPPPSPPPPPKKKAKKGGRKCLRRMCHGIGSYEIRPYYSIRSHGIVHPPPLESSDVLVLGMYTTPTPTPGPPGKPRGPSDRCVHDPHPHPRPQESPDNLVIGVYPPPPRKAPMS